MHQIDKQASWQKLEREAHQARESFPGLELQSHRDGGLVVGCLEIAQGVAYTAKLSIPSKYPKHEPILHCDPKEIPWELDRHVYQNGTACLCTRSETRLHWPRGSDLASFITNLVRPFFVGQFYYDAHGEWPPTGQRSHGKLGIIESFDELLTEIDDPDADQIEAVLLLLMKKNDPKGHTICPCGSGRRLRNCHSNMISRLRASVDPRHASQDLKDLLCD